MTKVSDRAKRFWGRLVGYYGAQLTDKFGASPPPDWCEVIDDASNETLRAALVEIRREHVTFPPNFPQFEAIIKRIQRPQDTGPSVQAQLREFVLRHRRLTMNQIRQPWRDLYRGHPGYGGERSQPSPDYAVVGVEVPADGEHPGYRVMVEDMQLGNMA